VHILAWMRPPFVFAAQAHRYLTPNVLGHGASNTTWTAVLAGLVPILGIAALGIVVYAFVRKRDSSDEMQAGDGKPESRPDR
jgi:hypothetical protein